MKRRSFLEDGWRGQFGDGCYTRLERVQFGRSTGG